MNVALFLKPKAEVAYIYNDYSVRQGLEKLCRYSYTSIPVLTRDGKYYSSISEGDFLWYIVDGENTQSADKTDIRSLENATVSDLIAPGKNPPVRITESAETLLNRILDCNYVPVIDDADSFVGIVTRKDVISALMKSADLSQL